MVTREGNTITVSFNVSWNDVKRQMDEILEGCEPPMKRDFTDEEIDGIMGELAERIRRADDECDNVLVDEIILAYCMEYLNEDEKVYETQEN